MELLWHQYLNAYYSLRDFPYNLFYLYIFAALGMLMLFGSFIGRRLQNRHKSFSHVAEMISTSLVIPFISVYWRLFGSIKYRVFFL